MIKALPWLDAACHRALHFRTRRLTMWPALVSRVLDLLRDIAGAVSRDDCLARPQARLAAGRPQYQPLRRLVLTDGVSRTLFEEFTAHRESARGAEETGWVLLGHREADHALALATLPAGTLRAAGVAHVRFNTAGQTVGFRLVRQQDRRLNMLGVVHTHPGSLRHPSDGDYRGDREWVGQLRGKEGVFGIGTADGKEGKERGLAPPCVTRPKPHRQVLGPLCLSWYSLGKGATSYRPLPVELILGPDLARPLRVIWPALEQHATELDRLARQQNGVHFALVSGKSGPALAVTLPLAEPGDALCVFLEGKDVRYLLQRGDDYLEADCRDPRIDRAVYLLLAELAVDRLPACP